MSELSRRVKQKYPEYQNIPDDQLDEMILAKYPEYESLARSDANYFTEGKKGVGGAVQAAGNILNLPSYALGGMMDRVQNDGAQALNPLKNPFGIPAAIEGVRDKKPVMQELPETLGIDPNSGLGLATGLAGELATPGIPLGRLFSKGDDIGFFGRKAQKLGDQLVDESSNIITRQFGQPALVEDIGRFGDETAGQVIRRLGLTSGDPQAARLLQSELFDKFDELAMASDKFVNTDDILKVFDEELVKQARLAANGSEVAQNTIEELLKRRQNFIKATEGAKKVPISKVTQLKRAASKDVPKSQIGLGSKGSARANAAEFSRKQFQEAAIGADDNLRQMGLDLRRLGGKKGSRGIIDLFERKASRDAVRNPISLSDTAAFTAGGMLGGFPGAAIGAALKFKANQPGTIQKASNLAEDLGKTLQKTSTAKKISNAAGKAGNLFKTLFRVSTQPESSQERSNQLLIQPNQRQSSQGSGFQLKEEQSYSPNPTPTPNFMQDTFNFTNRQRKKLRNY